MRLNTGCEEIDMKKPVKLHGHFVTDGNFLPSKHTKAEAVRMAKRSNKRAGLLDMVIHFFDAGDYFVVNSSTVGFPAR
jgi:hypothetical protein